MSRASVIDSAAPSSRVATLPPHLREMRNNGHECAPYTSKPCSSIASKNSSNVQPSATALKEFRKRWTILSETERTQCLRGTGARFFATVAELVPCLACRSGAESLFLRATTTLPLLCGSLNPTNMINSCIQLNEDGAVLFHTDQSFVLHPSYLQSPDATLALFLSHDLSHVIQATGGGSNHSGGTSKHSHKHQQKLLQQLQQQQQQLLQQQQHLQLQQQAALAAVTSSTSHHHTMMPPMPPQFHQLTKHNTTLKVKSTTFNYETTMKLQMHSSANGSGVNGTSSMLTTTTTHHAGGGTSSTHHHAPSAASMTTMQAAAMQSALSQGAGLGLLGGPTITPMPPGGPGLDLGGLGSLTLGLGLSSLSLGLGMNFAKSGGGGGANNKRCALHSAKLKTHPRPSAFTSLWDKMSGDYQIDITQIDSDQFLNDLECYLRRHRFCCRCKEKVLEAYDLLVGSGCSESDCEDCAGLHCFSDKSSQDDGGVNDLSSHEEHLSTTSSNDDDADRSAYLFDELTFCRDTNQIVLPCNLEYLLQLMDRADQEVVMDRHARTLAEAQDEVLTCLGLVVWDKLQMMWSKIQCEERSAELLLYCSIATIKYNFDVAVEALHGEEIMEQLLAEEAEDEKRTVRKKEKRKEKKKKKKNMAKSKPAEEDESDELYIPEKERQLLSSMGWEHDPVDGDDSEDNAIPEDDLVYWKTNSHNLESKRLEQRQKLQEKFQALLQRNNP